MIRRSSSGVPGAPRGGQVGRQVWWLAALAALGLVVGCGDLHDDPHGYTDPMGVGGGDGEGGSDSTGSQPMAPCDDGATRACRNELGVHGQVKSCFTGTQTCQAGVWGNCIAGATPTEASEKAGDEGGGGAGGGDFEG